MCAIQSDDWHADETVVFINGERYYLWLAIDSETRFILAFHLTKYRSSDSAYTLINEAKTCGEPTNFITDRLPSYNEAAATVLTNTKHIPVEPMSRIFKPPGVLERDEVTLLLKTPGSL